MPAQHLQESPNPSKNSIKRSVFNRVVRLRAEGHAWTDIAEAVGLPVAEIQDYPDQRANAWDEELISHARRKIIEVAVQSVVQVQLLMSVVNEPQDAKTCAETLTLLNNLLQQTQPIRGRQPRAPRPPKAKPISKPAVPHLIPNQNPTPVPPSPLPSDTADVPPQATEPAPTHSAPPPATNRWLAGMRRRWQQVRATVSRWIHALTPTFFLRC